MKRPSSPSNTEEIKARLEERVRGDDPAFERTRSVLRWLAGGWGNEFDLGDLHVVADPSADEFTRSDAIRRLADGLAKFWKPRGAVRHALVDSGEDRVALKRQAVNTGLSQASRDGREPQEIRFSKVGWLKDSEGRRVSAMPETEISWFLYTAWLRQRTLRLAGEWLVQEFGEPGVITEGPEGQTIEIEVDSERVYEDRDDPSALLPDGVSPETRALVELVMTVATPGQLKIIEGFLESDYDKSQIAADLGISPQNINEQLRRLRMSAMKARDPNP
jgi:hypothetical protein